MTGSHPSMGDWLALLPEPAVVIRSTGEIVAANAAFVRLAGPAPAGRPLAELVDSPQDDFTLQVRMWARNKQPIAGVLCLRTPGGKIEVGVHAGRLSGYRQQDEAPLLLLHLRPRQRTTEAFRTLTEQVNALQHEVLTRKRAEEELLALKDSLEERVAERTAQLSALAGRLIEAEEAERRRLAHALHDNIQQLLVTAGFQVDRLETASHDPTVRDISGRLRYLIQESISVSRSLTLDLSPPILHDAGLCAGLAWLARRTREQYELEVDVQVDERAEPGDEQTRVALFTAARELLFNIVKHADVQAARLGLSPADDRHVVLRVRDEGTGFDLARVEAHKRGDGFGLFSLRERAEMLGGEMRIDSRPGRGTTVEIMVPKHISD